MKEKETRNILFYTLNLLLLIILGFFSLYGLSAFYNDFIYEPEDIKLFNKYDQFCIDQNYDGVNRVVSDAGCFYEYACYRNTYVWDIKKLGDENGN